MAYQVGTSKRLALHPGLQPLRPVAATAGSASMCEPRGSSEGKGGATATEDLNTDAPDYRSCDWTYQLHHFQFPKISD